MLLNRKVMIFLLNIISTAPVFAQSSETTMDQAMNNILEHHYQQYRQAEYFSGAALSIYLPLQEKDKIKNFYIGKVGHEAGSSDISKQTLFQIGSITKSFTAAVLLQLEKENKLSLADTLGERLPQYNKWADADIKSMLDMTSGLPNYSNTPFWNTDVSKNPKRVWQASQLIDYVYPKPAFNPPLKKGYYYSNTGYVLSEMIAEKITGTPFKSLMEQRLIKKIGLENTFYPVPVLTKEQVKRMAHGYGYNQYDNPDLVGRDMQLNSMSWTRSAGGVIATSEDVVRWVKALFVDEVILDAEQKKKLTQLVSTKTGEPVDHASSDVRQAFGLGVIEGYDVDHGIGSYWFYEGQTLGFRALYMYKPCNGLIIATIFNSATNGENDHAAELLINVYKRILELDTSYQCEKQIEKKIDHQG